MLSGRGSGHDITPFRIAFVANQIWMGQWKCVKLTVESDMWAQCRRPDISISWRFHVEDAELRVASHAESLT
jgi:hypothetical protein